MNILKKKFTLEKYGLQVRFVEVEDAEFILRLRTDQFLSRYLHNTDKDIDKQKDWIKNYKDREERGEEYYFLFSQNGIAYGLERIYDIQDSSFTHGSLIFDPDSPLGTSVKADIITREIGFSMLNLKTNLFAVSKGNNGVITYHQRFKPKLLSEDEESFYYSLSKENFEKYKSVYMKIFKMK